MSRVEDRVEPEIVVEVRGGIAPDLADYARQKVRGVLTHTGRAVLRVHVRVLRPGDPAREQPVTAHANVDLDGRPIIVHSAAATPRDAVDLLVERLDHRLKRYSSEPRHGWAKAHTSGDMLSEAETPRLRPSLDEPEIVRHATSSPQRCSIDEAVAEMDDLGLDFHLFVETATGRDALVYRDDQAGLHLTRSGDSSGARPDRAPVLSAQVISASSEPVPALDTAEAIERLRLTGSPFLFYLDADHDRAAVLYRRDDGNYGLIDPAVDVA